MDSKPKHQDEQDTCFKARNMPSYKFFEPLIEERPTTKPQEFRLSVVPKRERMSISQEKRMFKAQPVPDYTRMASVAPVMTKKLTIAKPFQFKVDVRGA